MKRTKIWAGLFQHNKIKIKMDRYDRTYVMVMHRLKKSRFVRKAKNSYWLADLTKDNLIKLDGITGLRWGKNLKEKKRSMFKTKMKSSLDKYLGIKIKKLEKIPGLKGTPRPFQLTGISYINSRNGNALIADEMGLGKTIQALGWLQLHPEKRPAVIVSPASVKLNWAQEAEAWLSDPNVIIAEGRSPKDVTDVSASSIILINYSIVSGWVKTLSKLSPKVLVLDESHYIKNSKSGRTKAVQKLAKHCENIIALSGTPIINRPIEFYTTLDLIDRDLFPSYWEYTQRYCEGSFSRYGSWDNSGNAHMDEFHDILTSSVMLRRLKKDVLKELPPKQRTVIPIQIKNRREYTRAIDSFRKWNTKGKSRKEIKNKVEALKQVALKGKLEQCISWIEDFLFTGEKLVVFCHHHTTVHALQEKFGKQAVTIYGGTPKPDRQKAKEDFQKKKSIRLFIGTLSAVEGITLTASSNTCFLELWWSPGKHDQAEDRVHRIGQESDSVTAWYLLAKDTIEIDIANLIDEKRKVIASALDGVDVKDVDLLNELVKKIKTK